MGFSGAWAVVLAAGGVALGCTVNVGDSDADAGGAAGAGGDGGSASGATGGRAGAGGDGGSSAAGTGGGGSSGSGGTGPDPVNEILNDPAVQAALEEAREQGVDVVTHTEKEAPDPTGYYSYAHLAGTWVATGNGANVGFATTAAEMRIDLRADGSVDMAGVSTFDGVTPESYGFESGYILRGADNEVTLYGRRHVECPLSGAMYALSQAYIWSGTFEDGTGNWVDQVQFTVTTATEGELTSDCEEGFVGNTEVVGGWAVAEIPVANKVAAEDLELMCVDGGRGYAPTEVWTGVDDTACECTAAFVVSCEP